MNLRPIMHWFFPCVFLCVSGCFGLLVGDPRPYAYVMRKGNADTIGKWTMEQTDGRKIYDGLNALSDRMETTSSKKEAQTAFDWSLRIVAKVEDWPPDRLLSTDPKDVWTTTELIHQVFFTTAGDAYHHPIQRDLLYRLRPDEDHPQWREEWERSVAYLERSVIPLRDGSTGKLTSKDP